MPRRAEGSFIIGSWKKKRQRCCNGTASMHFFTFSLPCLSPSDVYPFLNTHLRSHGIVILTKDKKRSEWEKLPILSPLQFTPASYYSMSFSYPVIPIHFLRKSLDTPRFSIIENKFETHSLIDD